MVMTSTPDAFDDWYEDEHSSCPDLDEDANELDIDTTYNDTNYN
jgi:hypothetical protein